MVSFQETNQLMTESTVTATEEYPKMDTSVKDGQSTQESAVGEDTAAESAQGIDTARESQQCEQEQVKDADSEMKSAVESEKLIGDDDDEHMKAKQGDQQQSHVSTKEVTQAECVKETLEVTQAESVKETLEVTQTESNSIENERKLGDTKEQAQVEKVEPQTIDATGSGDSGKIKVGDSVGTGDVSSSSGQIEPHSTDKSEGDESTAQVIPLSNKNQEQSNKELGQDQDSVLVSQNKDNASNVCEKQFADRTDSNVDEPMETENGEGKVQEQLQSEQTNISKSDSEQIDLSRADTLKVSPPEVLSEDANEPQLGEDEVGESLNDQAASDKLELDQMENGDKAEDNDAESNGAAAADGDGENGNGEDINGDGGDAPPVKRKRGEVE